MQREAEMTAIPISLTLDQLLEGFKRLSRDEQAAVMDSLEDYFLGQAIAATMREKMYSREQALQIVEQIERGTDVAR